MSENPKKHPASNQRKREFNFEELLRYFDAQLGCDTKLFILNTNQQTKNIYITKAVLDAAREVLGRLRVGYIDYWTALTATHSPNQYVLLCLDGQNANSDLIKQLCDNSVCSALWTFDDPYNLSDNVELSKHFTLTFTNDGASIEHYAGQASFLPLAAPTWQKDKPATTPKYDVFFCGTAWPNRVTFLNKLLRDRPNLKYKLILSYNSSVPGVPLQMYESDYTGTLTYADFIEYARRSKITVSLQRIFGGTSENSSAATPGPRVFEIGAAGGFQLCELTNPNYESDLINQLTPVFSDYCDFLSKLDYWIDNTTARKDCAYNFRDHITSHHLYTHRLKTILSSLLHQSKANSIVAYTPEAAARPGAAARPRILYVTHSVVKEKTFGGLELHQDILKDNIKHLYDIYFFYTEVTSDGKRRIVFTDSRYQVLDTIKLTHSNLHGFLEHDELERFFTKCVLEYGVQLVHFFHFMNNVLSLGHMARSLNVPYVISIHDFYLACRNFNLLDYQGQFCQNRSGQLEQCNVCLKQKYNFPAGSQLRRRDYVESVLRGAQVLIYMSKSTKTIFENIYPTAKWLPSRIHGAPIPNPSWPLKRAHRKSSHMLRKYDKLRFVLFGNFEVNKGAQYFLDAVSACSDLDVEYHIHGPSDENIKRKLKELLNENIQFHGRYEPGTLNLGEYNFSLHLSNWPETYCQTLSEAWAARVVPIVTDIGALGDRVRHGINGYKVSPNAPSTLTSLLKKICHNASAYESIVENITDDLFLKQRQHAQMYKGVYSEVFERYGPGKTVRFATNRSKNHRFQGFTIGTLQRGRRGKTWNTHSSQHPRDQIVRPAAEADFSSLLHAFDGGAVFIEGSIDLVNDEFFEPSHREIILKNGEPLKISGWAYPRSIPYSWAALLCPVALIDVFHENARLRYLDKGNAVFRSDVAEHFEDENAAHWGLEVSLRLLNIYHMISGPVQIRLGWGSDEAGFVACTSDFVCARGVYGG